jgi:sugar O-acyltransferase (sialic acid O-acetyltransferase NeuD family)
MKNSEIILVGGGGHCRSVIDVIEQQGIYTIAGIVDIREKVGSQVLGYPVVAIDDDLPALSKQYRNFCITIGHIKTNRLRKKIYSILKANSADFPVIQSPHAYVARSASAGEGAVIMHQSVVNSNASLGVCCIANTGSIIEHDVMVKAFCHIGPGATINGSCKVEEDCLIGSNCVLNSGICIGRNTLIASGSVVISEAEANSMYAGNPALLKKRNYGEVYYNS